MEIELDPLSDVAIYQQLRDRMVEAIAAGRLAPGDQLASVRVLAVAFGINVATVAKGYELLRAEGLIVTHHKSGSVIARGPASGPAAASFVDDWSPRLATILAEASAQGVPDADISARVNAILASFADEREHPRHDSIEAPPAAPNGTDPAS